MQELFGLLAQSSAKGSKSTALQPLLWLLLLTGGGAVGASLRGPDWITVLFAITFGLTFAVTVAAYIYLLIHDRDALRSENFTIEKMRIERGIRGDTVAGFTEDGQQQGLTSRYLPSATGDK